MVCVHPHEASLDLGGEPVRLGEVLCPYARAQTVLARVREFYAFTIALIAVPVRHKTHRPSDGVSITRTRKAADEAARQ